MGRRLRSLAARWADADRREGGAILVEFVIVIPLFMVLVIGIFEIGKAWESNQTVVQASRSGARTVTQLGQHPQADREAVLAIVSTFGVDAGDIISITIFEADAGGDPDTDCLAVGTCNIYDKDDILKVNDASAWSCSSLHLSGDWPPCGRNNLQRSADFVGVTVEFREQYQTGFFGSSTFTITETTVMRIEPDAD